MLKAAPVSLGSQQPPANGSIGDREKGHRQNEGEHKEAGHVKLILPGLARLPVHALEVGEGGARGRINVHLLAHHHVHGVEGGDEGAKEPAQQQHHIVVGANPDVGRGEWVQGGEVSVRMDGWMDGWEIRKERSEFKFRVGFGGREGKVHWFCEVGWSKLSPPAAAAANFAIQSG